MGVQLDTTNTFIDGDMVNAAAVNNIIDQAFATLTGGLITAQTAFAGPSIDPALDKILIYDASASGLRQAFISALPGAGTVTSVGLAVPVGILTVSGTNPITASGTLTIGMAAAAGNKFLASPASGSTGPLALRALVPADLPIATITIAAFAIDWSLGNVFTKTLPAGAGNSGFSFSNLSDGQTIRVNIINNSTGNHTASWPSTVWRGTGPAPVVTQANGARDIFTFTKISGLIYGYADQNFTT